MVTHLIIMAIPAAFWTTPNSSDYKINHTVVSLALFWKTNHKAEKTEKANQFQKLTKKYYLFYFKMDVINW